MDVVTDMLFAAYDSCLNTAHMKYHCPKAHIVGKGVLHGWRLVFRYHADIIKDATDFVPVLIWNVPKEDVYALDSYNCYPNYYISTIVDVAMVNGKHVSAFTYVMKDRNAPLEHPMDTYFKAIEDGYTANGIGLERLYDALEESYYESVK